MADELFQRGSASIGLLLASLFLTSFGVSGQIVLSLSPATHAPSTASHTASGVVPLPLPAVLAGQIDSMQLVASDTRSIAAMPTEFLSEVTDIATPSAAPFQTPKVTVSSRASIKATSLKKQISIFPVVTKFPTLTPTVRPTLKPTIMPTTIPSVKLTPSTAPMVKKVSPVVGSLSGDVIFDLINKHRLSIGKPALLKDDALCSIAQNRAPQISDELYGGKKMHSGFYSLALPYWATENIAAYTTEAQAVRWWLSDYIHKKAIESDAKYSCAACTGRFCSQIFTSFVKK
ncbi:MAG: hypothetical protein M3Q44_06655 [bacterium]|nr:hypothetical protein [bacterium]